MHVIGEMGIGEMGIGEMGIGEMGIGEMGGHHYQVDDVNIRQ